MRRLWIGVLTTVIHLAFGVVYFDVVRVDVATPSEFTTILVLLYVATLATGLAVRARRQVIAGLVAASDAERREAAERLVRAEDDERARIAREMHDVLAHRLSILSVHAGALEHRARADAATPLEPEELRRAAAVIRTASHAALEELRDVLGVLRAGDGADGELGTARPQPTAADLDGLLAEAGAAGQRVELEAPGRERLADARPQLQRTVYRVVQEGLTNARKHAPGARVEVALSPDDDGIDVRVRNAVAVGVTPTEMPGAGAGLGGLATRVRLDGGTLAGAVSDGTFELHARIPWRP